MLRTTCLILLFIMVAMNSMAQMDLPPTAIERIESRGSIRIGMTGIQPPFSVKNKEGKLIGYEVELATMLAEKLNVKLEIVEMPFAKLLPSLERKQIDIVMSGLSITTERNKSVSFFGPYLISGKSLLTKSAILSTITKSSELNSSRYILTTLKGSTGETYLKNNAPDAQIILADNYASAVQLVVENKADAMLADYSVCAYNYFKYASQGIFILKSPLTVEPVGVAVPSDETHFLNIIENFFNMMELNGTLKRLENKYFKSGEWINQVE